ncbi:protein EXECUTER 2, chloroplastic isoform X2 [Salvia miltiorrhiza]|uniref:protein EXECUTER 2, chloroplastic isoform X2 n=1 Tax=Salvia miltiorrhiza TaxID=226208 RepID=UPI0025AC6355|nr:protein EXECUTER 2, chloroplastic isoform X2 [Salvia miltiorrhiza]
MAVANAWATTGHSAVPPPQLRPSSSAASTENLTPLLKKKFSPNLPNKSIIRRSRKSKLFCHCSSDFQNNKNHSESGSSDLSSSSSCSSSLWAPSSVDWDWNRWTRHFSEIEQAENYASVLKFQLEEAIEKEDFQEAAKLKIAIAEATSKDSIAEIMSQLKSAIDEERYHDASRLCRNTGSGLVGWWVGYSKDLDDPFGRIIRITPGTGRFIGKTYSPRQLVTSSPGTPLFEIFVVKNDDGRYSMQVAFLKQTKGISANSTSSSDKSTKGGLSAGEAENTSVVDVKLEDSEAEKGEGKSIDLEGAAEEGIKGVINFLKEKIPELKVKVMRVDVTEDITEDTLKQFIEEDSESRTGKDIEEDATEIDSNQLDRVSAQGDSDTMEDGNNLDMKLYIGGVLHNNEQIPSKDEFIRVPADIKDMERDSFLLHIPKIDHDSDPEENVASKVKVAAIAAQSVSDLMPSDIAKAFWSSEKVSPKISKDVREIVKLAVGQAQKRNKLSEYTDFSRITAPSGDLDPFEGLYVGAFGPYGTEVVQLRRKYGNWNTSSDKQSSDVEFFEYVEAVKLTGDLNVPAGQVTFRAKIGKVNRNANRGMYPHELGVLASYRGQGRIAEFGFRNPKWVEGELLQLNGKGLVPYVKGADLGFLYVVPEQSFLVLFNRLKLPE